MTASTQYGTGYQAAYGRLNGSRGDGWCAKEASRNDDWLQVDLGKSIEVCAIATQGDRNGNEWVTAFKLSYSSDGQTWTPYKDANDAEVEFHRQGDSNTVDQQKLPVAVTARYLRFNPTNRNNWNCLRVEAYGTEHGSCGIKPAGSRIVGGTQAQKDSWPWQVLLASAGGSQFCGGSLIGEQWVLTAAHCVVDEHSSQIVARLGAHKITDIVQEIQIDKILIHGSYHRPVRYAHDIALLKLKTPAKLSAGVGLVCLPDLDIALVPGKRCYITGWGTLSSGGYQPDYLQEASVPIVSADQCKASYGSSIHESMICAGLDAGGVDTCQGDSGGPMVCEFGGQWYLEGATSWGYGCAAPNYYGVYAKVRNVKSWVENTMNSN